MTWPKNSVNAWMIGGVENPIDSRVYKSVDMLSMGFPETAKVSAAQKQWPTPPPYPEHYILQDQTWLPDAVSAARAGNENIKLLVLLNYGVSGMLSQIFSGSTDVPTMKADAKAFAENLVCYLDHYGLNGFDIDWEPDTSGSTTQQQFVILFEAVRAAFGPRGASHYYLAFSPAPTTNLSPATVGGVVYAPGKTINEVFDIVTLQNYYAGDDPSYPSQFTDSPVGIHADLIAFGAKFESNSAYDPTPFQGAQSGLGGRKSAFEVFSQGVSQNPKVPYLGVTQWRLNSGNYQWEQANQMMLFRLTRPSDVFDDTDILSVAGNPLMTSLTVRSGDVVDAIEATNTGSFTMNGTTVSFPYVLPHGGDGGVASSLTFTEGDPLVEVSGYTGQWYGNSCVLQITLKTKSGATTSFPKTINRHGSGQTPFSIKAPAGQTIVAFSGSTLVVEVAGGGTTTIIGSLSASSA